MITAIKAKTKCVPLMKNRCGQHITKLTNFISVFIFWHQKKMEKNNQDFNLEKFRHWLLLISFPTTITIETTANDSQKGNRNKK